jgi:hypothetical protein
MITDRTKLGTEQSKMTEIADDFIIFFFFFCAPTRQNKGQAGQAHRISDRQFERPGLMLCLRIAPLQPAARSFGCGVQAGAGPSVFKQSNRNSTSRAAP